MWRQALRWKPAFFCTLDLGIPLKKDVNVIYHAAWSLINHILLYLILTGWSWSRSGSNLVINMLHLSKSFSCRGNQGTVMCTGGEFPFKICKSAWMYITGGHGLHLFLLGLSARPPWLSSASWWRRPRLSRGLRTPWRTPGRLSRSLNSSLGGFQCGGVWHQMS